MPELPEVETIKRQLSEKIIGKKIKAVEINLSKLVRSGAKELKKKIIGSKIINIRRRAKLIIIELDNNLALIIHLKLSGQLIYQGKKGKHTHLIYKFTDKTQLVHNDLRQFGYVKLIPLKEVEALLEKKEKYGPEPLEKSFTLKLFKELLKKRPKSKIKTLLMDQKFIAGIGNIYSDEILFFAGIRPTRVVEKIKSKEIENIFKGIKKILKEAIAQRGTSSNDYLDAVGRKGKYLTRLKVYQREEKPCKRCKAIIKRIKINGRSAHFCPKCQK